MKTLILSCVLLWLCSCSKSAHLLVPIVDTPALQPPAGTGFENYTIKKGQHAAANNVYKPVAITELKFVVRFDSSAIYNTAAAVNQYDINKLYGFADNNSHHHQYSARFGWNWRDGALRLYAYVYNEGKRTEEEMGTIRIGEEVYCSIKVSEATYLFTANDVAEVVPRKSITPAVKGYLLYPYFGGDEAAPHDVQIWIKNL